MAGKYVSDAQVDRLARYLVSRMDDIRAYWSRPEVWPEFEAWHLETYGRPYPQEHKEEWLEYGRKRREIEKRRAGV